MWVRGVAGLQSEQGFPKLHGDRTRRAVSDGPVTVGTLDEPDRGYHRGGTAREDLGEHARLVTSLPVVGGDLAFLGAVAEVARDRQQRVPRDARQQRAV